MPYFITCDGRTVAGPFISSNEAALKMWDIIHETNCRNCKWEVVGQ